MAGEVKGEVKGSKDMPATGPKRNAPFRGKIQA
jgi:hypothetical protein